MPLSEGPSDQSPDVSEERSGLRVHTCNLVLRDAIHATVQPAGKTSATKMVPGHLRQGEEEDGPRAHASRPG